MTDLLTDSVSQGATCAACATAATGGTCPNCGLYWFRNEQGKMVGVRLSATIPQPTTQAEREDFWRTPPDLKVAIERARAMDPRLAEAVNALGALWNIVAFQLLSDQQGMALILCHTYPEMTSIRLAKALKISQAGASNVLQVLVAKGLLVRKKRIRTPYYSVKFLWPMGTASTAAQIVAKGLLRDNA